MKKFFLMIQLAAMAAGSSAFALTGGPFENSDAGILIERGSFYQSTFSFRNGNGYALWTPDNQIIDQGSSAGSVDFSVTTLITPATPRAFSDHNANRSVLYYKGIIYVGSAFGSADIDAREINGFCNAFSDLSFETTTTQNNNNLFNSTQSQSSNVDLIAFNNRGYIANVAWEGKIYTRAPIVRFKGKGELSIISPSGSESIASLAFQGFSGLINAINTLVASAAEGNDEIDPALFTSARTEIDLALTALSPYLDGVGPDNSYNESAKEKVRVKGLRRFF
jgi:hypothetical protein